MIRIIAAAILGAALAGTAVWAFTRAPIKDCPQTEENTPVIRAFEEAPDVAARFKAMEDEGWVAGGRYAVMVAESCGVAGCNQTWLAGRLFTRTPGQANPQTVSVQAHVEFNPQLGKVFRVELIGR